MPTPFLIASEKPYSLLGSGFGTDSHYWILARHTAAGCRLRIYRELSVEELGLRAVEGWEQRIALGPVK